MKKQTTFELVGLVAILFIGRGLWLWIQSITGSVLVGFIVFDIYLLLTLLLWSSKIEKSDPRHYLKDFRYRYIPLGLLWGGILFMVGGFGYYISQEVFNIPQPSDIQIFQTGGAIGLTLLVGFLAVAGGVMEEFFFRGFILSRLRALTGTAISILTSSIIFSAYHVSLFQLLPVFLWGIGLSLLTVRTKNLWLAIIAHAIINAAGLTLFVFTGGLPR